MSKNKENEHFKNNPSERGGDSSNEKGQDSFQDTLDALEKDIQSLETELASKIDSISSSQDLRELREEVSRMQINKEVKDRFLKMIENVEKLSKDERKELLNEVLRDQEDAIPKVLDEVFPSHQFPYMRKLEDSPLGQDLLKDAAGIVIGATDSAATLVKLGWTLIKDLFLLPRDILRQVGK